MAKEGTLLIVDDNRSILAALRLLLEKYFARVLTLPTPNRLATTLREEQIDVILLDMNFTAGINTGNEGIYWLSEIHARRPDIKVVLFTAYADIDLAVRAMRDGAVDFVVKPWDNDRLVASLRNAYNLARSAREVKQLKEIKRELASEQPMFWGESPAMARIREIVEKVAATDANILITGENGTGKEMLAREIHNRSARSGELMVSVDMGAVPETLFESELFGHVKGAFTGATEEKAGYFLEAQGGTLFMDEVENLSIETQRMLLRAMEERSYRPVGGKQDRRMDVRIIAATNEDLFQAVAEKRFRKDLLYRFHDFTITVPALQNCLEDILPLADFFREQSCAELRKEVVGFDGPAKEMLLGYSWPGNVRQLKQVVYAAVLICKGNLITPDFLRLKQTETDAPNSAKKKKIDRCLQKDEKRNIEQIKTAISISKGNLTQAAALLGISRPTLYKKMSIHGISK